MVWPNANLLCAHLWCVSLSILLQPTDTHLTSSIWLDAIHSRKIQALGRVCWCQLIELISSDAVLLLHVQSEGQTGGSGSPDRKHGSCALNAAGVSLVTSPAGKFG